jgi:hypothetical protein
MRLLVFCVLIFVFTFILHFIHWLSGLGCLSFLHWWNLLVAGGLVIAERRWRDFSEWTMRAIRRFVRRTYEACWEAVASDEDWRRMV